MRLLHFNKIRFDKTQYVDMYRQFVPKTLVENCKKSMKQGAERKGNVCIMNKINQGKGQKQWQQKRKKQKKQQRQN